MDFLAGLFWTPLELFFGMCALGGGLLFFMRTAMQFMGHDTDGGADDALHVHDLDAHLGDSDLSFQIFSMQGITAFFTMFGLVGLALLRENKTSELVALIGGLVAGSLTVYLLQRMFIMAGRMKSAGNVSMTNAMGAEGTVYLTIPAGDVGKVEIKIQNRLRVVDARSEHAEDIPTGERVRVVRVLDNGTLIVEKIALGAVASAGEQAS